MASETTLAPLTMPACQVDLTDDTAAQEAWAIRIDDLADELVSWSAGESVIASKQFDISVADAAAKKANRRVTPGPAGFRDLS
jgi:hypothetical protein